MLDKQKQAQQVGDIPNQIDYNSDPDEDLDMTPEWMKGRETVEDELEDTMKKPPFDCNKIMRG